MVFGLVLGAASIPLAGGAVVTPTVTGIGKSVGSASGDKERDAERGKSCRLKVFCEGDSPAAHEVHGKYVGLTDDKVYIMSAHAPPLYPFTGFYISYPSSPQPPTPLGLVTMIPSDPPAMGWIYADRKTFELKYGNKTASIDHVFGPWDMTEDKLGVTLEEQEQFVALETVDADGKGDGTWQVYYDREGDGTGLPPGRRRLEVSIEREVQEGGEEKKE